MQRKYQEIWLQITLSAIDILGIILSFVLAYWFRFYAGVIPILKGYPENYFEYIWALFATILVWELLFIYNGLYKIRNARFRLREIYLTTQSIFIGTLILMALTFLYRQYDLSRLVVFFGLIFCTFIININRFFFIKWLNHLREKGWCINRTVVIGTGSIAQLISDKIKKHPESGYEFIGFVNGLAESEPPSPHIAPLLGSINELDKIVIKYDLDKIIIAATNLNHDAILELILQSEKHIIDFYLAADLLEIMVNRVTVDEINGYPLLLLKEPPLKGCNIIFKRSMDIMISAVSLILLSPLFGLIAILIKLDSPGTVFYLQERVGIDGKQFIIYKFRSMIHNAEEKTGPVWASPNDTRRTKFGTFLRHYNLDELPQLYNVLKGDMSLVGPRPERLIFVNQFKEKVPRYMVRHRVKSGITGWAQVNGWRGNSCIEERTKYDLFYIENWSLLFDIKILLLSFKAWRNAY